MFIKKKDLETIKSILMKMEAKLNAYDLMVEKYEREIKRLEETNKRLEDKFMARDFEQLQLYQANDVQDDRIVWIEPDEDEYNAGEVLNLEAKRQ